MNKGMAVRLVYIVIGFIFLSVSVLAASAESEDRWLPTNMNLAPTGRYGHTSIWTGSEMIVWGGYYPLDNFLNDGYAYNPIADYWTPISEDNAPDGRLRHTAIWTGEEMIVWGGESAGGGSTTNTGGRYNPETDSWQPLTAVGAPGPREMHSAVWTGSKMIIWGGCDAVYCSTVYNDGALYDPDLDEWTPISVDQSVIARHFHQAVWTGSEMIVFGGSSSAEGMSYNPAMDTWDSISQTNAPAPTYQGASIWTGNKFITWGGCLIFSTGPCLSYSNSGGIYDPVSDTWVMMATLDAPSPRWTHTAVWTGNEMIVWGGCGDSCYNDGGLFDPVVNGWAPITLTDAPKERSNHKAVWTGSAMIVWGGCDVGGCGGAEYFDSGGRYYLQGDEVPMHIYLPVIIPRH